MNPYIRSQRLFNVVADAQETSWVPRAILSDLEPGTMDAVRSVSQGERGERESKGERGKETK
mgnify:CR=1 FL=1